MKHKHAEVIKAWADGKEIEYRSITTGVWCAISAPTWLDDREYRIKPEPPAKVYPRTMMDGESLRDVYINHKGSAAGGMVEVANAALRHAVDSGQLVEPAKIFKDVIEHRAARDMVIAEAVRDLVRDNLKHFKMAVPDDLDLKCIISTVKD